MNPLNNVLGPIQEVSIASPEYRRFIEQLKARVLSARFSAARAVNRDVILLYWDIGRGIVEKQQTLGWGDSIVEMVSADLRQAFPGSFGFSPQNVWRMLQIFRTYTDNLFLSQAVRELEKKGQKTPSPEELSLLVRELIAAVPWGHHANVLAKLTDPAARLYYLQATARFGWSRNVLLNQIKAGAYERAVVEKKTHNFPLALPEHLAEQAEEMMKSSYNLEFGRFWRQLPQRGCVSQPRVAAWPLPWVTINHVINPNGVVSGEGSHYAAIVILRSYSFGIFNERPRALSAGCRNSERNARLFGRGLEEIGVFSGHRGGRGRSCALLRPIGPDHRTGRLGEGTQTSVQHLDQTTGTRIGGVCVAGGIWRVFCQRIRHRQNMRLHSRTAGASQNTHISGRIQGVSPQTRYGMGRAVCVGMTQPRWGRSHGHRQPRVAALPQPWAIRQNPVGIPSCQPPTPAKELLAEFWKLEREAEKMLEGLGAEKT